MGGTGGGGTVFDLTPSGGSWNLNTLYDFDGTTLGAQYRTLVMDKTGNLYGTSSGDGVNQPGSIFKLTWSNGAWTYTSLHDFTGTGPDAGYPQGGLVMDVDGNLYGTASMGGSGCGDVGCGLIFEITP